MTPLPLSDVCILPSSTLLDAAKMIERNHHRTVIVVEDLASRKVIGVLSEGDILRALIHGVDVRSQIREFVQVQFKYLEEEDVNQARELFAAHGFGMIPVVDESLHLRSVLTLADCLRAS